MTGPARPAPFLFLLPIRGELTWYVDQTMAATASEEET
jgi:hypothetical protein